MARIVGNLRPEDDYMHELGPEPNFNESMYFNFFDRERSHRGVRAARQPGQRGPGRNDRLLCSCPTSACSSPSSARPIANNDSFDAGGLRFDVLEPTEKLRSRYEGGCHRAGRAEAPWPTPAAPSARARAEAHRARPGARGLRPAVRRVRA